MPDGKSPFVEQPFPPAFRHHRDAQISITLYTTPDCLRYKVVKGFLAEHQIVYKTVDFKAGVQTSNILYRTNRKATYRNPEGVEFPLFDGGTVIKRGPREVIAYLLSGYTLEDAVMRSDSLYGRISGLYLFQCPTAGEDHLVKLVQQLARGDLMVYIQTDGRNSALLEHLIGPNALAKAQLNIPGPVSTYGAFYGSVPTKDELAKTIELVKMFPDHKIRFFTTPPSGPEGAR